MITPTQLFSRFIKEIKIYKPIMVFHYGKPNSNRYFYEGIIEDRLAMRNIKVKDMFPKYLICGVAVVEKWNEFLKQYKEEEINYIPKPSNNFNKIPNQLLIDFGKILNEYDTPYHLHQSIMEEINTNVDEYFVCKLMREKKVDLEHLIKILVNYAKDDNHKDSKTITKLNNMWSNFMLQHNYTFSIIY